MSLPEPVLPKDDIVMVQDGSHQSASLIWSAWSKDPIKAAVLRAVLACKLSGTKWSFGWYMALALGENGVCFVRSFHWK